MDLSIVTLKKIKDAVEHILHVPGNFRGGILEMTVVVDKNLSAESVKDILPQVIKALKMHSEVFKNVRFNMVSWEQGKIENRCCPMQMVMTSGFYNDYEQKIEEKKLEDLLLYLKEFQARAKLILFFTDGTYQIEEPETLKQKMQPFLGKKLLCMLLGENLEVFSGENLPRD
ncbi:MAG: hypothetical protein ACI4ES_02965 [Roseburia sp.]